MSNDAKISSFPTSKKEALAFLYMQNQDLSGKTPEDLAAMYDDAYARIDAKFKELIKERKRKEASYRPIYMD